MIHIADIPIIEGDSILDARNKIYRFTQDLGFRRGASTRLATITSNLARRMCDSDDSPRIRVGFDKRNEEIGISLVFEGQFEDLDLGQAVLFFDSLDTASSEQGIERIEGFTSIPDPDFEPSTEAVEAYSNDLLRLSRDQLLAQLKTNNLSLTKNQERLELQNSELATAREEAESAVRLKSEFLANMSHELRTPLNSIIGFTGRVIKKAGSLLEERQLQNLYTVKRNAIHLLNLINDMLDISKIEAGKMEVTVEEFRLDLVISEVLDLMDSLVGEKSLEVTSALPDHEILMRSDKMKFKQVLINLLSNAIKFTESGSITVSVKQVLGSTIPDGIYFHPHKEYVIIEVKDSGTGMSASELAFIFDAFRQVDGSSARETGGTGLGLTITKRFIELLEGRISVESVKGEGSAFTITLPRQMEEEPSVPPVTVRSGNVGYEAPEIGSSILCIDDNPEMLELLEEYLEDDNYHIVGAQSASEGFDMAKELRPFAITLDVMMPEIDGWSVLKRLKRDEATKDIPVVMVSITENRDLAKSLGAFESITKPVDPVLLSRTITRTIISRLRTVLIVDEDSVELKQILESCMIEVKTVDSGRKALECGIDEPVDLVVLELTLPDMSGFELIEHLKKNDRWGAVPVVIYTSQELDENKSSHLGETADAVVLKKQSSLSDLLKEIASTIRHDREP